MLKSQSSNFESYIRENEVRTIFGIFQFVLVATHCDINLFKIHNGNTRTKLLIKTPERRQ